MTLSLSPTRNQLRFLVATAFIIASASRCGAQVTDSTTAKFAIIGSIQLSEQTNYGLLNQQEYFDGKQKSYKDILRKPELYISAGLVHRNMYHFIDYSHVSRKGSYNPAGAGGDSLKMNYIGYQFSYEFLKNKKFPVKPLLSLNVAYTDRIYYAGKSTQWGGSSSAYFNFREHATTWLLQIPVGFCVDYKGLFFSASYNILVAAGIKGTTDTKSGGYDFVSQTAYATVTHESYKGSASKSGYAKQQNIFTFRIGYAFELKKKRVK